MDCGHEYGSGERRHEYDHHLGYAAEHHEDVEAVCSKCHHAREDMRRGCLMSDNSKIEWCSATWNPVTGCTKVSPGCDHCYAETFAERWRGTPGHHFESGFDVTLRPERLEQPLHWKRPRQIFVNSMSDLFHEAVPDEYIVRVFDVMQNARRHTFQVLTKRHARLRSFVTRYLSGEFATEPLDTSPLAGTVDAPPPNIWLGVSVRGSEVGRHPDSGADRDARRRAVPVVREPLLGPIDLTPWMPAGIARWQCGGCRTFFSGEWEQDCLRCGRTGYWCGSHAGNGSPGGQPLSWVICGGESGPKARPMHPAWATRLRDQCAAASVPFFFKQWGAHRWVEHSAYDHATQCWVADGIEPQRVSKKLAGRELDGQTWDEFPRSAQMNTPERSAATREDRKP